jgi:signal peptidase I
MPQDEDLRQRYANADNHELLALVREGPSVYTERAWALLQEEVTRRRNSGDVLTFETLTSNDGTARLVDGSEPAFRGHYRGRRAGALICSLFVPGSGHFLLGHFRRGVVLLLALGVCTLMVPLVGMIAIVAAGLTRLGIVVDSLRVPMIRRPWRHVLAGWAILLVTSFLWSAAMKAYITAAYTIPSGAMMDTLLIGDYIETNNVGYLFRAPQRGDVIVFKYPNDESRDFIKRIVAVAGDTVQVRDNRVILNGRLLVEPYVRPGSIPAAPSAHCGYLYACDPLVVPTESYFVMGDNRDNSQDSRYWGFVHRDKIRGKGLLIYWSWDSERHWPRFGRIGRSI